MVGMSQILVTAKSHNATCLPDRMQSPGSADIICQAFRDCGTAGDVWLHHILQALLGIHVHALFGAHGRIKGCTAADLGSDVCISMILEDLGRENNIDQHQANTFLSFINIKRHA